MLGYGGYGNRREFIGGMALVNIAPIAFAMALTPLIPLLMSGPDKTRVVLIGLALTSLVVLVLIAMVWGLTALVTRRARDMGWPAWIGVGVLGGLFALSILVQLPLFYGWLALLAAWPGGRDRRRRSKLAAGFA